MLIREELDMKPIIRKVSILPFVLALSGCVAGQSLQTTYTPPAPAATTETKAKAAVQVVVTDDRPYVKNGEKPPHYIGKYRAGFGNPWNVYTENDEPLASVLARDLATELGSLGYTVKTDAPIDRKLALSIKEWNFDGYQNGKMWYQLEATVHDATGKLVATEMVGDETKIKGTFWMGAKGGFEKEMPKLYAAAVTKVVRENPGISAALGGASN
jgi:uncharacterized lipoprotein YajG